jgi:AcrR family transcriptional regulator
VKSAAAKPGPKPTLTREVVIEAALDLIDAEGLAALNLRKLAARLGVSAMTPYNYFADKAELTGAMVGHALAALQLEQQDRGSSWDLQLERAMRGMHDAFERHPGVIELIMAESDSSRLDEFRRELVELLVTAGLSDAQARDALRSMTSYILGYTMLTRRLTGSERAARRRRSPSSFDHGLALLMDGIRAEAQ